MVRGKNVKFSAFLLLNNHNQLSARRLQIFSGPDLCGKSGLGVSGCRGPAEKGYLAARYTCRTSSHRFDLEMPLKHDETAPSWFPHIVRCFPSLPAKRGESWREEPRKKGKNGQS